MASGLNRIGSHVNKAFVQRKSRGAMMSESAESESQQLVRPVSPVGWFVRNVLPIPIFLAAIGLPILMGILRPKPPAAERVDRTPLVVTAAVMPAPSSFEIVTHGTVVPKREVVVSAEVSGKIVTKSPECDSGHFVKAGTVLFTVDPIKYQLQTQQLDSEIKQVEIDLLEQEIEREKTESLVAIAEEDLAIAQRELDRYERLIRNDSASVSQRDQQSSRVMQAKNSLQQLTSQGELLGRRKEKLAAQLELTKTRLEMVRLDLQKTSIVAPIDGYITDDLVETSSYVQPGTAMVKIEDRQAVEVRCSLKVEDLYWLTGSSKHTQTDASMESVLYRAPRVPATVTYEVAGKTYRWDDAFLSRYEGTGLNERTRTVPCRVEVPLPDQNRSADEIPSLVRGMFVHVRLRATPKQPLLQIPDAALRPNREVWRVTGDRLEIVRPRVARMLEDTVLFYVDEGSLKPGDDVVTSPLSVAVHTMKVRRAPATEVLMEEEQGLTPAAAKSSIPVEDSPPPEAASKTQPSTSG
jgi:multidrug efflux pump subunit AcrA (membrane-fusion protein)